MRSLACFVLLFVACTGDQFTTADAGDDSSVSPDVLIGEAGKPDTAPPPLDAGPACNLSSPFVVLPIDALNTGFDESSLRLVPSSLLGVFSSNRAGTTENDLYSTSRSSASDSFGSITALTSLNSAKEDVDPWISEDGLTIYFASNRAGTFDLYKATRSSTTVAFNAPAPLLINSVTEDDTQPFLTSDGKDLYFSAVRTITGPSFDIYHSTFASNVWSPPTLLSSVSSSSSDDDEPVVSYDKLTMYFASARNNGQMDIFVSTRTSTSGTFGSPKPVNELNDSAMDDRPSWVSADGCALVFHSNRAGSQAGFNIYVGVKPP
jgi:Tol biopolymer transport system component